MDWSSTHTINVGGQPTLVSESEYVIACLPKGTPIEWGGGRPANKSWGSDAPPEGAGIMLYSYCYDGVSAVVQMGHKEVGLHPWAPDNRNLWVRRLEDMSRLEGQGLNGDGI